MRELVLEVVFVQESCNSRFDKVNFKNLVDARSFGRVSLQHQTNEIRDIFAKVSRHVGVLADDDLLSKLMQTLSVEGRLERAHFVE